MNYNNYLKAILFALLTTLLLSLFACGSDGAPQPNEPPGDHTPPTTGTADAGAPDTETDTTQPPAPPETHPWPRTITDQAGRAVTIESPPQRIVSGFYISSSTIIALGAADRLVGIEARAGDRPIYALAAPELLELPSVGTARDFNLEACLELRPDLVVLPYRLRDIADILWEMGVPAILVNPESLQDLLGMIDLIRQATGAEDSAEHMKAWFEGAITQLNLKTAAIAERPVVYMCGTASWLTTTPRDMFQASLIDLAGGRNAAGDIEGSARIDISYEQLLVMNPEVIIIPPEAGFGVDDVMGDQPLAEIAAVRNGRVYKMPEAFEAWDSPIPSFILGAKWLLSVLHGDIYAIEDLKHDAAAFYREFYGIEIDTALIS